jgi:hypothetical protein
MLKRKVKQSKLWPPKKGCFVKNEEKKNCIKEEDWEINFF